MVGVAAAASHMVCDFGKNTREAGKNRMRAFALNDIFRLLWPMQMMKVMTFFFRTTAGLGKPDDVLIAISGSGNSANILKAIETAPDAD